MVPNTILPTTLRRLVPETTLLRKLTQEIRKLILIKDLKLTLTLGPHPIEVIVQRNHCEIIEPPHDKIKGKGWDIKEKKEIGEAKKMKDN